MYVYIKQHENNNKNQSEIKRERERKCSYASYCLVEFVISIWTTLVLFVCTWALWMLEVYNNLREAWPDVHDSSCLCDFKLTNIWAPTKK